MKVETVTLGRTELERPETVILCTLRAALQGVEAKLSRVRVQLMPIAGKHICRVLAWCIRGDVVVVEVQANSARKAIDAAAKGLRDALSKQAQSFPQPRATISEISRLPRRDRTSRASDRLLLAVRDGEAQTAGPDWAAVLARELQVELHVLRVLEEVPSAVSLLRPCNWVDVARDVQRTLDATRETRSWCNEVLPDTVFAEHVCVRVGEFAEEVAMRAKEIEPDLIVLSGGAPSLGNMVTGLACAASRAVLVARKQNSRCTLLAATSLKDDNYPVLRKAAELSHDLHASVVALHNVERSWAEPGPGPAAGVWGRLWTAIQKERLELAADRLLLDGEVYVSHDDDPVAAILTRAEDVNADTIVVGTKAQSWLERLGTRSVAAEVVEQTNRSVLVVPLT